MVLAREKEGGAPRELHPVHKVHKPVHQKSLIGGSVAVRHHRLTAVEVELVLSEIQYYCSGMCQLSTARLRDIWTGSKGDIEVPPGKYVIKI